MRRCPRCGAAYGDEVRFCPADGQALVTGARADDLVGQLVAERYQVMSRLGEGGMGQVYLADHVKMGRKSALKVLGRGLMSDPEAISRFNREAANASRISHPNVCAVYDFGETADGRLYLAMEYVEGRTLQQLLHDEGPLPLPRAAALLEQIAAALAAAHELGIVHRDLKPDNIMIAAGKGRETVKVVDFGIAKAAGAGDQEVTRTGFVIGTPDYMSPEQLSGDPLDARTDVYALGLVFFRMLTGALPFEGATGQDALVKRLTQPPRRLAEASPSLPFPPALQAVLDRALARQPAERYATAPDFARAVTRIVEAARRIPGILGSEITPPSAVPAARAPFAGAAARRERRRPGRGLFAAAALVLALGAGAVYAHRAGMVDALLARAKPSAPVVPPATAAAAADSIPAPDTSGPGARDPGELTADAAPRQAAPAPTTPAAPARSGSGLTLGRPIGELRDTDERADPGAVAALAASVHAADSTLDEAARATHAIRVMNDSLHVARLQPAIRARAALLAGQETLPDSVRAAAAVLAARVAYTQMRYGAAREWLIRAIRLAPRQEYRDMLAQLPDGGAP